MEYFLPLAKRFRGRSRGGSKLTVIPAGIQSGLDERKAVAGTMWIPARAALGRIDECIKSADW